MSNLEKYEAFFETNSDCLSATQIDKYAQEKLDKKEKYQFERHLLHCELCAEAVEGILAFEKPINLNQISTEINAQITKKYLSKNKTISLFAYVKVAASIIILVTAGIFLFDKSFPEVENLTLSDQKIQTEEALPTQNDNTDIDLNKDLSTSVVELEEEKQEENIQEKNEIVQKEKQIQKEKSIAETETKLNQDIVLSPSITETKKRKSQLKVENQDIQLDTELENISSNDAEGEILEDGFAVAQDEEEIVSEEDDIELIAEEKLDPMIENTKAGGVSSFYSEDELAKSQDTIIRERKEKTKPSLKTLKKQVKKDATNLNLRYQYALAYFETKQWGKSLEQLEKVLADTSTTHYHNATWYKALILIEQGKIDLAKTTLNKLLQNQNYKDKAEEKLKEIE